MGASYALLYTVEKILSVGRGEPAVQRSLFLGEHGARVACEPKGSLETWDLFVCERKENFVDSVAKRKQAEQTLLQKALVPGRYALNCSSARPSTFPCQKRSKLATS